MQLLSHGTITAIIDDKKFEITSLRKDISTDGRHAKVLFSKDWREDAERRDFTFNSIYSNIYGEVFDPFNGRKDLENGCVTFIGDPSKRIKEDYLRILRYIRFFLNYSKKDHEPKIKKIIKQNLDGLLKISKERLIDELKKIIFSKGFINLKKDDFSKEILELVFPSLNNTSFLTDKNKLLLEDIQLNKNFIVLLSAMMIKDLNSINYILYKFNFSNQDKQRLLYIHDNYQRSLEKSFFDRELKKRIYFGEKESLLDLITLQLLIFHKNEKALNDLIKITKKIDLPKFPYNADFLIKNFDYKPGKKMGKKLKELETLWVDNDFKISNLLDPKKNTLIFLSSRKVYKSKENIKESGKLNPLSNYSKNKLVTEHFLKNKLKSNLLILRISNIIGFKKKQKNLHRTFVDIFYEKACTKLS